MGTCGCKQKDAMNQRRPNQKKTEQNRGVQERNNGIEKIKKVDSIGDYTIIQKIGSGAFGEVFLVHSPKQQKYAVKKIQINKHTSESSKSEALILLQLSHNNIVKVREFFLFDQEKYLIIIMEYCPNGNLNSYIGEKDQQKIQKFMKEISKGIQYLHQQKIIHRDLKPENIFIAKDKSIKIGDLGLAKLIKSNYASTVAGTPLYMAPEMEITDRYGFEVDIWALGIIFIELAIGERIWTLLEGTMLPHRRSDFPNKKIKNHITNKKWLSIIEQMLVREPKSRIGIAEVIRQLESTDLNKKKQHKIFSQEQQNSPTKAIKVIKTAQYYDSTFTGEMIGDSKEGKGVLVGKNGDRYEGDWKNDKKNGRGVYTYADGAKYIGEYKDDIKSGRGVYQFAHGAKYDGQWKDGNKNGRGVYYWANGNKQEGEFVDGLYHGSFIFTSKNGAKYKRMYEMDKKVKEEPM